MNLLCGDDADGSGCIAKALLGSPGCDDDGFENRRRLQRHFHVGAAHGLTLLGKAARANDENRAVRYRRKGESSVWSRENRLLLGASGGLNRDRRTRHGAAARVLHNATEARQGHRQGEDQCQQHCFCSIRKNFGSIKNCRRSGPKIGRIIARRRFDDVHARAHLPIQGCRRIGPRALGFRLWALGPPGRPDRPDRPDLLDQ